MLTTIKTVPELKKNDKVLFYGAIFEVLEDARNVSYNENRLPNERTLIDRQPFFAKCKFISYAGGTGKKGDRLLENYDGFQGNSYANQCVII